MDLRFDVREWGAVQGEQSNALAKYTQDAEKTQYTASFHLAELLLYYWLAIIY